MYFVIHDFYDLSDDGYLYRKGDSYPRKGKRASKKRLSELSSTENKHNTPFIEEVSEDTK